MNSYFLSGLTGYCLACVLPFDFRCGLLAGYVLACVVAILLRRFR